MDTIMRFTSLLSSNSGTTSATANTPVQISGGPSSNWPLTAVSASFWPSYHRQAVTVTNTSTVNMYVGPTNSVSSTAFMHMIAPNDDYTFPGNGSVPLWLVCGTASQPFQMQEWQ